VKLLLDTHVLVWWLAGDPQLPVSVQKSVESVDNEVFIGVGCLWEMVIKLSLGKLQLEMPLETLINQVLPEQRIALLPIAPTHLLRLTTLPFHHRDPFDRLLAAQALAEAMNVASRDDALDAYGIKRFW